MNGANNSPNPVNPEIEPEEKLPSTVTDLLGISSPKRILVFLGCLIASLIIFYLLSNRDTGLTLAGQKALFILIFAAILWITDAIPAFSVGILIIGLQILLLGRPGGVFAKTAKDWEQFVMVLGHPLIWLFFGGFVMAAGLARTGLDRELAARLMARTGNSPRVILLGIMIVTFILSMFISNTATASMMIAVIMPLLTALKKNDRFGRGLILSVAVAANLGGMGTIIGSPPNAIAIGNLVDLPDGPHINFLDWMIIGFPVGIILLAIAYLIILFSYPAQEKNLALGDWFESVKSESVPAWQKIVTTVTMFLTVALWLTSQWNHLPTAVVSFIPIILLTTTGILDVHEIRGLSYDVLFLLAGGLALGHMVMVTGLSSWIVEQLPVASLGLIGGTLLLMYITVIFSNFMSNTAAANILIPISVMIATGFEASVAVPIAIAASSAMCLPISTPPNAIAFATNRCETKDFLYMGLIMGVITPLLGMFWTSLIIKRLI